MKPDMTEWEDPPDGVFDITYLWELIEDLRDRGLSMLRRLHATKTKLVQQEREVEDLRLEVERHKALRQMAERMYDDLALDHKNLLRGMK